MEILERLEPRGVFRFFEELCAIPHGSGNTKGVSDWLMAFARERKLEAYQDQLNNVIIIKEATPGYENAEPVLLQGHMDMVCEKAPGCAKDMDKEGLDLAVLGFHRLCQGHHSGRRRRHCGRHGPGHSGCGGYPPSPAGGRLYRG